MAFSDQYRGTGVAMITPFKQNGEIDFNSLSILTDSLINNGINYLVVLGTTAETPTLSSKEKSDVAVRCSYCGCVDGYGSGGGSIRQRAYQGS